MDTRAISKPKNGWPSMFENSGWLDRFFNTPIDEFVNMRKVMNRHPVNAKETDRIYGLTIATPGLEKNDIKIEIKEGVMTISSEKEMDEQEKTEGRYNRREYNYSSWSRSFMLPEDCDESKILAEYDNGELKITIPKKEVEKPATAKTISIS